jgi:hypothetical protein
MIIDIDLALMSLVASDIYIYLLIFLLDLHDTIFFPHEVLNFSRGFIEVCHSIIIFIKECSVFGTIFKYLLIT